MLSVVIPCYNEEEVLPILRTRLCESLAGMAMPWEVIFVNDGSRDRTLEMLREINAGDPRFRLVSLSRNFGHQAALCAGIHYASGEFIALMDADLQDPPEMLAACLARLDEGFDVIYAIRQKRKEGLFKRTAYASFYRLMKRMANIDVPLDAGDFCVMRRSVADAMKAMPERNIYLRGMRAWSGFRQTGIAYDRPSRAAGTPKYTFSKLLKLALDGIFSFSTAPLRMATYLGLSIVAFCFIAMVFVLIWGAFGFEFMGRDISQVPGWASGVAITLFLGGIQLLTLGIIGEYVARIYDEVKQRPRWIVSEARGWPAVENMGVQP